MGVKPITALASRELPFRFHAMPDADGDERHAEAQARADVVPVADDTRGRRVVLGQAWAGLSGAPGAAGVA